SGTIVQSFIRSAHGKTEICITQSVIGYVRRRGGCGAVDLRGGGLRIGEVKRHADEDAEVLVEVVSGVGLELENLAVRVHGALKFFKSRKSLLGFRRGQVLAKGRKGYEQSK